MDSGVLKKIPSEKVRGGMYISLVSLKGLTSDRANRFSKGFVSKYLEFRSFSGPYFPIFRMNTEIYSANLCIQFKCGKIRTRKTLCAFNVPWLSSGAFIIVSEDLPTGLRCLILIIKSNIKLKLREHMLL